MALASITLLGPMIQDQFDVYFGLVRTNLTISLSHFRNFQKLVRASNLIQLSDRDRGVHFGCVRPTSHRGIFLLYSGLENIGLCFLQLDTNPILSGCEQIVVHTQRNISAKFERISCVCDVRKEL